MVAACTPQRLPLGRRQSRSSTLGEDRAPLSAHQDRLALDVRHRQHPLTAHRHAVAVQINELGPLLILDLRRVLHPFSSVSLVQRQLKLCMMLVRIWFGLYWVLSSFFDHYILSSAAWQSSEAGVRKCCFGTCEFRLTACCAGLCADERGMWRQDPGKVPSSSRYGMVWSSTAQAQQNATTWPRK